MDRTIAIEYNKMVLRALLVRAYNLKDVSFSIEFYSDGKTLLGGRDFWQKVFTKSLELKVSSPL